MNRENGEITGNELIFVLVAFGLAWTGIAKEKVVIVPTHPDDLITSIGFYLLAQEKFDVHVVDFTHGERGLGVEAFEGRLVPSRKRRFTVPDLARAPVSSAFAVAWIAMPKTCLCPCLCPPPLKKLVCACEPQGEI